MANYIKITGNKEKVISDFIQNQKKYWFFKTDKFTGIRTVHYKTSTDLKEQIKELVKFLQETKSRFKQTDKCISFNSEYLDIHSSENINN